jgi:hypothetical protein
VAAIFISAGLLFAFSQSGFRIPSLDGLVEAQERPSRTQRVSGADCTFLREPENFRGLQARHRLDVSRRTESISRALENPGQSLVAPQDIPRNNLIDNILFDRMVKDGVASAPLSTDAEFIRRVTLDLTGRIPSPEDVAKFLQETNPYKREILIDSLIGTPEFIDKWTMFFGDLYKVTSNSSNIVRYIGGRESFYQYIKNSISENKSYTQMATEMITAVGDNLTNGAVNFIVGGNVPMGPAQDTMDGLAVVTATTFLGLSSMDCLLCHDGAGHLNSINLWGAGVKRSEAWGMSAFFARTGRRFERASAQVNYGKYTVLENAAGEYMLNTNSGNRQTRAPINGKNFVDPRYMFGGGGVNTGENRRQALARQITSDPQFARAIVNYLWEELMVEALVSPSNTFDLARLSPDAQLPDGWSLQPANPTLLEALAQDFRDNNYNLRYLIGLIAKSSAYQLSAGYPGSWKVEYVPYYARKFVRRLDAEEIHDAIVKATGLLPVTTFRDGTGLSQTILGYPIVGDDGLKLREVLWAMQLPEPFEPRQRGDVRTFLDSFLRGNRDANLRTQDSSILQSLNLMNNAFVMDRIHQGNRIINIPNTPEIPSTVRKLLSDPRISNDQIIIQLYLHTLSRYPSDAEKSKTLTYFASMSRTAATESLQWVLLNKVDFIFNY